LMTSPRVDPLQRQELFGQVGRVLNAGINYGPQGKSKGTAEVTMATLESALKAVKTYHGVKLDGRPLSIVVVDAPPQPKPITQRLSGLKPQQQPKKNGKNGKNATPAPKRGKATAKAVAAAKKATPKKKKPARKPKEKKPDGPKPTAADLDASLDAYKASADVQMAA
jgi:THO complex subunit 4